MTTQERTQVSCRPASPRARAALPPGVRGSGLLLAGLVAACGGGGGGGEGESSDMTLVSVSNGFGVMVPHQVFRLDANGLPTPEVVSIRKLTDLVENVSLSNPVLPVTAWPASASLSNGDPGNHYVVVQFTQPIKVSSVLDPASTLPGGAGLKGPITVTAIDPATGTVEQVLGRGFVAGKTFAPEPANPGQLELQRWVKLDASGKPVPRTVNGSQPGLGFPGTESSSFDGGAQLLAASSLVFVVDSDDDLSTHETFPTGRQIRVQAGTDVLSTSGSSLVQPVLGSSTVGPDLLPPEVLLTPPPGSVPVITPSLGETDVDPGTDITIAFTEPVQPLTVGSLPSGSPPAPSASILVTFGPQTLLTTVPFTAQPVSIFDFSVWRLTPFFAFPGSGPTTALCGTFGTVSINVLPLLVRDLVQLPPPVNGGNPNTLPAASFFVTGEGPGLVNAPVVPDAILAVRAGSQPSLSVIDLNGFGQSTGNPEFDFTYTTFPQGNSNFPNNPNLKLQGGALLPSLVPGTCTVNGGSQGVFSLTKDSSLDDRLLRPPLITSASDIMIGQALELVFNNAKDTSGCQAGGGNICALSGLKLLDGPNPVSLSPHPNPPSLIFPPLCLQPFIGGSEPTSVVSIVTAGPNLLFPGDALGDPLNGIPPSGLLCAVGNSGFLGPDSPATPIGSCVKYLFRQQIGHFLYLIDRARKEIVVLNSNRFTVLDRIDVPDPTDLAMGPNLDYLAVSNQKANLVSFIDINPASSSFHKVIKTTPVGAGPRGIAWDPGNEGLIVCNEDDDSLSLISAYNFEVRKVVTNALSRPFDVAITQRQLGFGWLRNVWFGWIMNRNGDLAMYESGPNGINGWGYDDVIGTASFQLDSPQRIIVDPRVLRGAVWIAHQNPLNPDGTPSGKLGGAVTNVVIESAISGILYLNSTSLLNPQFRQMSLAVQGSFGTDVLTGVPTDMAMDDMQNASNLVNLQPPQGAGVPLIVNGKALVRGQVVNGVNTGITLPVKAPEYLFVAIPNSLEGPGVVDVVKFSAGGIIARYDTDPYQSGSQSIQVGDVRLLCDYWRQ